MDNDRCFICRQFDHLPRECSEKDMSVAKVKPREKHPPYTESPQLYGGVWDEEDKEEVMAVMCHSGKTYSFIQLKRVDEAFY